MSPVPRRDILRFASATVFTEAVTGQAAASRDLQSSATWPQYQFNAANTGVSREVQGPQDGIRVGWGSAPTSEGITTSPTLVDDTLFVGSWDDHLYAIDTNSGEVKWQRDLKGSIHFPAPAVDSGRVVVGTEEGKVYALTPDDEVAWSVETNGPVIGSATIADGTVYVPNLNGTLLALNLEDGTETWRFETTGIESMYTTPAVKDGTVYVGSMILNELPGNDPTFRPYSADADEKEKLEQLDAEGRLYAINTTSGEARWEASTNHIIIASPVVDSDAVYVGSWDKFLYALAPEDGTRQWRAGLSDVIVAPPVLINDRLYVGAWDGEVYAIQTQDGATAWRSSTDGHIVAPPTSDGNRLYLSDDRWVLSLRLQDGTEQWGFNTHAWDLWAPAIGNNTVYVTDGAGRVFELLSGTSRQVDAPDPENGGDILPGSDGRNVFSEDRGFFTNGGDPPEFLTNVFNLTMLGFLLSVAGIVHQMLEGR